MATQWVGLKTLIPAALAFKDALFEGRLPAWGELYTQGTWPGLLGAAFGAGGAAALMVDGATDAGALLLPTPLDGFDVPPLLADLAIAGFAQASIRRLEKDAEGRTASSVESSAPAGA